MCHIFVQHSVKATAVSILPFLCLTPVLVVPKSCFMRGLQKSTSFLNLPPKMTTMKLSATPSLFVVLGENLVQVE